MSFAENYFDPTWRSYCRSHEYIVTITNNVIQVPLGTKSVTGNSFCLVADLEEVPRVWEGRSHESTSAAKVLFELTKGTLVSMAIGVNEGYTRIYGYWSRNRIGIGQILTSMDNVMMGLVDLL
ncbi:hypothetical protein J6590_036095 [Homalodisca vitripennis]|nr:hypothetical protein J6590_036089 [Homalodisca vitripennis]KAG8302206.1 hypothetical protein J6590_036095 [Homalodisca vitripennis]